MQFISHFAEYTGGNILAVFVHEIDLNVPSSEGKSFDARWLVSVYTCAISRVIEGEDDILSYIIFCSVTILTVRLT